VLVCAAVHAAAGGYLAAPQTFWRSDNAVRFVQLESVRRNGYRNLAGGDSSWPRWRWAWWP